MNLRDKERIKPFLAEFEKLWLENPDLRFGQLVSILGWKMEGDIFFHEEDEWLKQIRKEMQNKTNSISGN